MPQVAAQLQEKCAPAAAATADEMNKSFAYLTSVIGRPKISPVPSLSLSPSLALLLNFHFHFVKAASAAGQTEWPSGVLSSASITVLQRRQDSEATHERARAQAGGRARRFDTQNGTANNEERPIISWD